MPAVLRHQAYLLRFSLAALARRKGRNLALLLVYVGIVFLLASVMFSAQSLRKEAELLLADSPEILVQRMQGGRHALIPADYLHRMGRLRGVSQRQGRLWSYFLDAADGQTYAMRVDPALDLQPGEVLIGADLAQARSLRPGDDINFYLSLDQALDPAHSLQVKALLDDPSALTSAAQVVLSEADFRRLFAIPEGQFTDLALWVRNPREVRKIAEKLTLALPDSRPLLREEIERTYDSLFAWRQGMIFLLLAGALMAFAIFAWDKAAGLSLEERREIGILKAVGWETGDLLRMKFWEGAFISLSAFVIGTLAAYLALGLGLGAVFDSVLKGWAVLYPPFRQHPSLDGLELATLFFFTVFPYSVATIIPVWRCAITDPDQEMR
jgi:ABC-type lipoprotein release transport system permease subunit